MTDSDERKSKNTHRMKKNYKMEELGLAGMVLMVIQRIETVDK